MQSAKVTGSRHAPSQHVRALIAGRSRTVKAFAAVNVTQLSTGAWVVAPPYRSRGIVHFLGGAFAGAAPQLAYRLLLDSLAAAGYTAVATPYAVTFRHDECARTVRQQFLDSLEELRGRRQGREGSSSSSSSSSGSSNASNHSNGSRSSSGGVSSSSGGGEGGASAAWAAYSGFGGRMQEVHGQPQQQQREQQRVDWSQAAPEGVPVFGLGHSNGSLLHLLIGSTQPPGATDSNIVMSFNNKQVKDAIPVPGLMEGLPAAVQAAAAPFNLAALPDLSQLPGLSGVQLPSGGDVLRRVASWLPRELGWDGSGQVSGAGLLLDQIPAVLGEVGGGARDFRPSPAESRALLSRSYCVRPTLVLRFAEDPVDESGELTQLLQPRLGRGVTLLTLPGNHLTPCGADLPLPTRGSLPGPAEAALQALKQQQQADVRRLCGQLVGWMDSIATR